MEIISNDKECMFTKIDMRTKCDAPEGKAYGLREISSLTHQVRKFITIVRTLLSHSVIETESHYGTGYITCTVYFHSFVIKENHYLCIHK